MPKLVLKTILNTLLGIIAGLVLVWGIISLFFPKCFVDITYKMGMEKVSAWYAASSYVRTRDLSDLAMATEMSVYAGNDKQVVKYGGIFIRMDGFDDYCEEQDKSAATGTSYSYKQFIYGHLSVSNYKLGDKNTAIKTAFTAIPENLDGNTAIFMLVIEAVESDDRDSCLLIRQELVDSDVEKTSYYDTIMNFLQQAINGD